MIPIETYNKVKEVVSRVVHYKMFKMPRRGWGNNESARWDLFWDACELYPASMALDIFDDGYGGAVDTMMADIMADLGLTARRVG